MVPNLKMVAEGRVQVLVSPEQVFYNPAMEFDRDLSVLALQTYRDLLSGELKICDPMTGCGIRGVRYLREVDGVTQCVFADSNSKAVDLCRRNVESNGLTERSLISRCDANSVLSSFGQPGRRLDVVDLDPFGSPSPYLDTALRSLKIEGLLALTATDVAVLFGVYPRACLRKYGARPVRCEYGPEVGVRILLATLSRVAASQTLSINPLFSYAMKHYARLFVKIQRWKHRDGNIGYLSHCFSCLNRFSFKQIEQAERICAFCGSRLDTSGPLWLGQISESSFIEAMLRKLADSPSRFAWQIRKLLLTARDEVAGPATYFVMSKVSEKMGVATPRPSRIVEDLRSLGYFGTRTTFATDGIRTDAEAPTVANLVLGFSHKILATTKGALLTKM